MKKWKNSGALSSLHGKKKLLLRALCVVIALGVAASLALPLLLPDAAPERRYDLETAGSEIDFVNPENKVHTAEDGVAVVNGGASPETIPENSAEPVAPAMKSAMPAASGQGGDAATHSGFTMPVAMDGDSIGVLTIPDIDLSVRVYETGDDMADMEKGAAHFKSTSAWEGNVGISAHNIALDGSPGCFMNLHTLQPGAIIRYETALGTREYAVESITEIEEDDWSTLGRTEDNRITLITCISGKPASRLSVQAVEKQG